MTLTRLELLRMVRTHRWMVLFGTFVFFGALGPVTAAYMHDIVARFGGGVEIVVPDPTPVDGIAQFVSNASQLGVLAVIVVAAGAVAMDTRPEVAAFLRTRVREPVRLLTPRYLVATGASVAALAAGTGAAWLGTALLIGGLDGAAIVVGTLYGGLYLAFAVAVVAAVAGFARSTIATIFGAVVVAATLPVLSIVDGVAPWLPSRLVGAVVDMTAGAPAREYLRAAATTAVAVPVLLWVAVARISAREL